MAAFLAMGGYAAFVWPAYGISIGLLAAAAVWTIVAERRAQKRIADIESRRA